jgi:hypothetical protein
VVVWTLVLVGVASIAMLLVAARVLEPPLATAGHSVADFFYAWFPFLRPPGPTACEGGDAADCMRLAEDARRRAEKATSADTREPFLDEAKRYDEMAKRADDKAILRWTEECARTKEPFACAEAEQRKIGIREPPLTVSVGELTRADVPDLFHASADVRPAGKAGGRRDRLVIRVTGPAASKVAPGALVRITSEDPPVEVAADRVEPSASGDGSVVVTADAPRGVTSGASVLVRVGSHPAWLAPDSWLYGGPRGPHLLQVVLDGTSFPGSAGLRRVPLDNIVYVDSVRREVQGELSPGMKFVAGALQPFAYMPAGKNARNTWQMEGVRVMVSSDAGMP